MKLLQVSTSKSLEEVDIHTAIPRWIGDQHTEVFRKSFVTCPSQRDPPPSLLCMALGPRQDNLLLAPQVL